MFISNNPKRTNTIKTDIGKSIEMNDVAHIQITAASAIVGNSVGVLAATALTAAAQAIKTNITNPTIPRNIRIIGNVAGIAGNVTIKGTNYSNESISEVIALNGLTAVDGVKAFKTVTEIDLPIQTAAGNTVSVGVGEKLGLPYKLTRNTVLAACLDNVREATAPTVTVSSTSIDGNTIKLNSALNSKVVDIYLIV